MCGLQFGGAFRALIWSIYSQGCGPALDLRPKTLELWESTHDCVWHARYKS